MRRSLTLAALGTGTVLGTALPAVAQATDSEWQANIEIVVAGSAVGDETPLLRIDLRARFGRPPSRRVNAST